MSASNPRWARGSSGRAGYVDPQMRVSDAERADVADRLSKHYSDGRLDQAEFNERLDRAMKARTRADLGGLFSDLPNAEEPRKEVRKVHQQETPPRNGRPRGRFIGLVLIVVIAVVLGHALGVAFIPFFFWHTLTGSIFPWLLIALLVFLWLRYGPGRRHRP
jgi:Domain of unknown function (DUF1707)